MRAALVVTLAHTVAAYHFAPLPSRAAALAGTPAPFAARAQGVVLFDDPPPEEPDEDAFAELLDELTELQKAVKPLPPLIFGASVNAVTVLGALLAWFVTPPVGKIAALGSLSLGGYGGSRLSKRIRKARRGVVPAAIAEMVQVDGIAGLKPKVVAELMEEYNVDPVEFEAQLSTVYSRYLRQLLSEEDGPSMAMVRELGALRRGIGLRWNATAAIHAGEAGNFFDGEAPPANSDQLPVELKALFWISSTLFATSKAQADTAQLASVLGADEASAQRLLNEYSKPLYRSAVLQAVAKYNRTEAPGVLSTARRALCLSEATGDEVHAAVYDAQLALLLDDEASSGLSNEDMEILGELEGMLQVRGAAAALQRRTEPLYRELAAEALAAAFESPEQETPTSLMGKLAVRQQELKVPAPDGKAILICEARRLAAERLASAAELMGSGKEAEALATAAKVAEYATFIGAGLCGLNLAKDVADPTPTSVAERYLGALTIPPEVAQAAQALAKAAAAADAEGAGLTNALFAMSDPETAAARDKYAAALDGSVSAGDFSSSAAAKHAALASELSLPPAVSQRLGLDAYYGWLSDASERVDLDAVETAETARSCLAITLAGVAELYANTNVDELALTTAVEQLLAESNDGTLSADAQQRLSYVETQLAARAGVASGVVSAATAD